MNAAGEKCSCCGRKRLIAVRGTVVCPACDRAANWPKLVREP